MQILVRSLLVAMTCNNTQNSKLSFFFSFCSYSHKTQRLEAGRGSHAEEAFEYIERLAKAALELPRIAPKKGQMVDNWLIKLAIKIDSLAVQLSVTLPRNV